LHAHRGGSVALRTVFDSTSLFPFRLSPISAAHLVAVSGRLDVLRHGLDQDLIMLRTPACRDLSACNAQAGARGAGRESLPAAKGTCRSTDEDRELDHEAET